MPIAAEEKPAKRFADAAREQTSFLAPLEKRALVWMAQRMPRWVNSDHLTLFGLVSMLLAGLAYAVAGRFPLAPLAVVACLVANWFGDSLDGTLARVRNRQRPRYGFYVDHVVDAFSSAFLLGGLALSPYMHPAIACGLLVMYLMLSIQSYLAAYTLGTFQISFGKFSPTEIRLVLAIGNLALLWRPWVKLAGYGPYRLFDVGGLVAIAGMAAILIGATFVNTRRLHREEPLP